MVDSRVKGAAFERECVRYLATLGITAQRNLAQWAQKDQPDIITGDFIIECKRYKEGNWHRPDWWQQLMRAFDYMDRMPVLIYKFDRQPMRFVFRLCDVSDTQSDNELTVTMDESAATEFLKTRLGVEK